MEFDKVHVVRLPSAPMSCKRQVARCLNHQCCALCMQARMKQVVRSGILPHPRDAILDREGYQVALNFLDDEEAQRMIKAAHPDRLCYDMNDSQTDPTPNPRESQEIRSYHRQGADIQDKQLKKLFTGGREEAHIRLVKALRFVHANDPSPTSRHTINAMSFLFNQPGTERFPRTDQAVHSDWMLHYVAINGQSFLRRLFYQNDVPISVLFCLTRTGSQVALYPYTHKGIYWSDDMSDHSFPVQVVNMEYKSVCAFRGDTLHYGMGHDHKNLRSHVYGDMKSEIGGVHVHGSISIITDDRLRAPPAFVDLAEEDDSGEDDGVDLAEEDDSGEDDGVEHAGPAWASIE